MVSLKGKETMFTSGANTDAKDQRSSQIASENCERKAFSDKDSVPYSWIFITPEFRHGFRLSRSSVTVLTRSRIVSLAKSLEAI